MNTPLSRDAEILKVFIKNANDKIRELNVAINLLLQEGAKPEFLEIIFRTTLAINSFANTCSLNNITDFISTVLNVQFNDIRMSNQIDLSEMQKLQIKNNFNSLKNMINEVQEQQNIPSVSAEMSGNSSIPMEKKSSLLESIGQLSVWSFHDILNALAKIEGFTEMIGTAIEKMSHLDLNTKNDIKLILQKNLDNALFITNSINQVRSLRGKTLFDFKEYNFKELIRNLQETMYQPKKSITNLLANIPDVRIQCDRIIFAQLWGNLWRLMHEWQVPRALLVPAMTAQIAPIDNKSSNSKCNAYLFLYIWTEPMNSNKFSAENLTYSKQTPFPDLANVFYFSTKAAQKIEIDVDCSKTPFGNAIFRIKIPCIANNVASSIVSAAEINKTALSKGSSSGKSVLVVDDEKDLRTILSLKINRMGYVVHTASSIPEAVQILNEKDISLVISDLFLQGESGLELLKSLSVARPNVPFVFISGADEDDVPESIFAVLTTYARAFLTKPVATPLLKETIEKIIGPGATDH